MSRAELEQFVTPEIRERVRKFMAEPGDDDFDLDEVIAQNMRDHERALSAGES